MKILETSVYPFVTSSLLLKVSPKVQLNHSYIYCNQLNVDSLDVGFETKLCDNFSG